MLLAERLALLLLDPESGSVESRSSWTPQALFAAALLGDLILADRLHARSSAWEVDSVLPLAHPLLAQLLQVLGAGPIPATRALARARRGLPRLRVRLLDALARRDLVHRVPRLALVPRLGHRYPLRSQQAHAEVLDDLRRAAANGRDAGDYAQLVLADAAGLLRDWPAELHGEAYAALSKLDDGTAASLDPVLASLSLMRQALLDSPR